MNQTVELGCLKTTQRYEQVINKTFQRICPCEIKSHLGKTPQRPLAGVEPANLEPSFHFPPAGIAPRCTASVRLPEGEQRTTMIFIRSMYLM